MAKKNKNPEVRFKDFKEGWEQSDLSQIIDLQSGRDYKHLKKGNIPVYGTGGYMLSVNDALSNKDSIGIGRKGTIDKPYILKAPFWTVDTLFYAVPKNKNDLQFLNCIFQNIDWKNKDESTGVPSLSKITINSVQTYTTKPTEQKQIGAFFQNLDTLISQHQKKYDKLVILKKAMLEKMFPKNSAVVPEIRFNGFSEDWVEKELGKIGFTYTGLSGKTKNDFGRGKGKYVTYMGVFNNPVSNSNMTELVEIDNTQNEVNFGDVFFTTSSETPEEVGMSSVWLGHEENIYLNIFCFGYLLYDRIDNDYLSNLLRSPNFRKKISFLAQGISRFNISKNKVKEISIEIPCPDEQQKIGEYFKNLDKQIALHKTQLEKLNNIKKACFTKMFVSQD